MKLRQAKSMILLGSMLLTLMSCGTDSRSAKYKEALQAVEDESYGEAIDLFTELEDYKDSPDQLLNAWYLYGTQLFQYGEYELAEEIFTELGDYSDSSQMIKEIHYEMAEHLFFDGDYDTAQAYYSELGEAYSDTIQDRLRAINCAETADLITAELQSDNNTLNYYMGMYGLDFDFDLHYDASAYTYYFDVYYAKGFSTLTSLFGSSLKDVTKDNESSGMEREIYTRFREAGYEDITCEMRYFDHSGELLYSFTYSNQDYLNEVKQEESMGIERIGAFKVQNGILTEYTGHDSNIVIPNGVVEIGEGVFRGNEEIETVTMPDTVLIVQAGAFLECKNLKSVNFSHSLEEIGYRAFESCNLTTIEYPSSIQVIGDYAFAWNKITNVSFADGTERLVRNSYDNYYAQEIIVPEGVRFIDDYAFLNCGKITSLTLPSSLETIAAEAFDYINTKQVTYLGTMAQWSNINIEARSYDVPPQTFFEREYVSVQCSDGLIDNTGNVGNSFFWDMESYDMPVIN